MKFAFWKRKKAEAPPSEPPRPLLSVVVCGESAEMQALPDGCEYVPDSPACEPHGRYILFWNGEGKRGTDFEKLLGHLAERTEDLILFRSAAKDDMPDAEYFLRQGTAPRRCGLVANLELFRRLPPELRRGCRGDRLAALLLLAETHATIEFLGEEQSGAEYGAETAAESLRAFIRLFGRLKATLDEKKYRFAFAYACTRIIGTYAELAAENKAEELRLFDDFLKDENRALRVAAKERSAVVRLLMRHNFRVPLWLRPVCAASAAKDRAKR